MNIEQGIKNILSEQVSGYRTLLDVLRKEREYLFHFNAPGVETLSKEKDTIVLQLRLLEEERVRLIRAFAADHQLGEDISLQRVSEITGDDGFQKLRSQLVSLLQGITEFNDFNRVLIERSSGVVKNALHFLGSIGANLDSKSSGTLLSREA
ncbi:MAG: flagellar protein FlgN [Nitrospirae bacterium]|nr:flagellar protein FlgN [Nitrospirota bacterium]NTW65649.1 flagellar protein FlgN [Nitrospirota bacterium]